MGKRELCLTAHQWFEPCGLFHAFFTSSSYFWRVWYIGVELLLDVVYLWPLVIVVMCLCSRLVGDTSFVNGLVLVQLWCTSCVLTNGLNGECSFHNVCAHLFFMFRFPLSISFQNATYPECCNIYECTSFLYASSVIWTNMLQHFQNTTFPEWLSFQFPKCSIIEHYDAHLYVYLSRNNVYHTTSISLKQNNIHS